MRINEYGVIEPTSFVTYPTPDDEDYDEAEPAYAGWPLTLDA